MSSRLIGTVARGLRAPIVHEGDDLTTLVTEAVLNAACTEGVILHHSDILGVTESVVARAQGNYATVDQVAADVRAKFPGGTIGLFAPLYSRRRFGGILRGIARGAQHLVIQLPWPRDERGKVVVDEERALTLGLDPFSCVLNEADFVEKLGRPVSGETGADYLTYYRTIVEEEGATVEFLFGFPPAALLERTPHVLCCAVHRRQWFVQLLHRAGAETVLTLADLLNAPVNGSGYNPEYGLLGSNWAGPERLKLFPRDCDAFCRGLQQSLKARTGVSMEVLVYGDGSFKDPVGGLWELSDPVVCPGCTDGLKTARRREVKLKYLAERMPDPHPESVITEAITELERAPHRFDVLATPARRLTDLVGSLCDLTSGSGDKGTPIVLIQGYLDSYLD
ncbi:MAG: coenzyme F420-0:L-glutamate ligase [Oscillospiraceae bacterium]|nr:coenzyme F420-0:L-glutamate ligase [Oscillospiraceae bacterium]